MKRTVKIKYHSPNANRLKTISKGDCIDLYTDDIQLINYQNTNNIDTVIVSFGISVKLPKGYIAKIYPRSSTYSNYSILQTNSVGIIDNNYNGDKDIWKAKFVKVNEDVKNPELGSRVCQFEIVPSMHMKWYQKVLHLCTSGFKFKEVKHLSNKNRGGFGSTGL